MSYTVNAWLEDGTPHLRLVNTKNGNTSLSWDFPKETINQEAPYKQEMQKLFKQLLLLACANEQMTPSNIKKHPPTKGLNNDEHTVPLQKPFSKILSRSRQRQPHLELINEPRYGGT